MNIMFVSVKERTPIIGIQKSLGAKNYFIMFEFLFEAFNSFVQVKKVKENSGPDNKNNYHNNVNCVILKKLIESFQFNLLYIFY